MEMAGSQRKQLEASKKITKNQQLIKIIVITNEYEQVVLQTCFVSIGFRLLSFHILSAQGTGLQDCQAEMLQKDAKQVKQISGLFLLHGNR